MRPRRAWRLALLCLVAAGWHARAQETDVLARVGTAVITKDEFRTRFALTIFPYKDRRGADDVVRHQFLFSLIAEKLLAAEALRTGIVREERFDRNKRIAEEMFVRDKLYHDEIRAKVRIPEADVRQLFEARRREVEYQFLFSKTRGEIDNSALMLRNGIAFDSLLAARQAENEGPDTNVTAVDRELRAAIAHLAPGQVSGPVHAGAGWYIVRRVDHTDPIATETEYRNAQRSLASELRRERETRATMDFMARLWKGRKAVLSEAPYRAIGQAMLGYLRRQARSDTTELLSVPPPVFDSLRTAFGARMTDPFATIDSVTLSVGDMLDRIEFRNLRVPKSDIRKFPGILDGFIHELLDAWVVTMEGYARGLQSTADVRRDVAMWVDNGLAQSVPEMLWEQYVASDDSLWNFYIRNAGAFGPPPEVRIAERCVPTVAEARSLLHAHQAGTRLSAVMGDADDVEGWFPVTARGAIGRAAFGMRVGAAAGPFPGPHGSCVFELLDRRYPADSTVRDPADLRRMIEGRYRDGITAMKLEDVTRRLASGTPISIDEDALKTMDVSPLQMFTVRYMGFGGRIPASPGVYPLFEAVMEGMSKSGVPRP